MAITAEADHDLVSVRIECDGRDGDCPTSFEHERLYAEPLPEPASGDRNDPAWAPLRAQSKRAEHLAEESGWRIDDYGEFCPPCAPHVREDDYVVDDEEWWPRTVDE